MLRGGTVDEIKEIYSKVKGSSPKEPGQEPRLSVLFVCLFFGRGHCVLNIESIRDSQIRDWEEEGEGLPFPVVFFVILNHILDPMKKCRLNIFFSCREL